MSKSSEVIAGVGLADRPRKSHWPARMDLAQSGTGLLLGLFMWGHMFFVSTILISNDAMWMVTKAFEGYYVFGRAFPKLVSGVVTIVSVLFMAHAFLAMRKFPADYRQYRVFVGHKNLMHHSDTSLWWLQVVTGFLLFFLGPISSTGASSAAAVSPPAAPRGCARTSSVPWGSIGSRAFASTRGIHVTMPRTTS